MQGELPEVTLGLLTYYLLQMQIGVMLDLFFFLYRG